MVDRYTKAVLTVIALALIAIAMQQIVPNARASIGSACGEDLIHPCYVKVLD